MEFNSCQRPTGPPEHGSVTIAESIFDPDNPHRERDGSTYTGPDADNISHMPEDVIDGEVSQEEIDEEQAAVDEQDDSSQPVTDQEPHPPAKPKNNSSAL